VTALASNPQFLLVLARENLKTLTSKEAPWLR
jgi:hypothetical protein